MQHVLILHDVLDYTCSFDDAADIRRQAGERSYQVLKYQDSNRIVHFSVYRCPARQQNLSAASPVSGCGARCERSVLAVEFWGLCNENVSGRFRLVESGGSVLRNLSGRCRLIRLSTLAVTGSQPI
jgi:hypothetical protein